MTPEEKFKLVKETAENDLLFFIKLVHPARELGAIHEEVITWMTRKDGKSHKLLLLPRDHQKSAIAAYYVAWRIVRNPTIRVLYISSTTNLAEKQLKFIQDILTCDQFTKYWPEMLYREEGKREKWTASEISVDHPKRKAEFIRDPTIFTAGLNTTVVGLHCDLAVLDDVVVDDNSETEDLRLKVKSRVSYLASIAGTDGEQLVVGTRYHPKDLYGDMMAMYYEEFDEDGNVKDSHLLYEIFQKQVESNGDGTGEFIWPRKQRKDGKWFGFSAEILSKKKAQYASKASFRAQYYNDPNDPSDAPIQPTDFQYYDRTHITNNGGHWYYKANRLNIFAAIDFAFSLSKQADYTSIVVVGVDSKNNYYVLEVERFKTDKIQEYFNRLLRLHSRWQFRKLRAEVTVAQTVIVRDLKENYIKPHGLVLSIDEVRPIRNKEERIEAILQPRYSNKQMWHYRGGNCSLLEEELTQRKPQHDDIKDALASCIEICLPPSASASFGGSQKLKLKIGGREIYNTRFGGLG